MPAQFQVFRSGNRACSRRCINMASGEASTENKDSAKSTPRDARAMKAILKEMGVEDYEPRVINQMLEFTYRE